VRVRVRLFAALREELGETERVMELPPEATVADAWEALAGERPALRGRRAGLAAAVNRRYAPFDTPLAENDELVFIPPVSGGRR
jgi:molybdopterin converting factor subunit 1